MLGKAAIQGFLGTTDPARARDFFEGALGLTLVHDDPFALVFDAGGRHLRVAKLAELAPQPFTVLGWQVPDVSATVKDLAARGVKFERYEGMEQDELGIWSPPGGGHVAWFKDPDGNTLSVSGLS